jgi:hypothetical protein
MILLKDFLKADSLCIKEQKLIINLTLVKAHLLKRVNQLNQKIRKEIVLKAYNIFLRRVV